ncbi:MAG: hypothetical protein ACLPYS_20685, partial [Vulcanimicrobiaceae bacterium]
KFEQEPGPFPGYRIKYGNSTDHGIDNFVMACPPGLSEAKGEESFKGALETGCKGKYAANTNDPKCTAVGEQYDCVEFLVTKNGAYQQNNLTKVFEAGMSVHICGSGAGSCNEKPPGGLKYYCPNNWSNSSGGVPTIPSNDSRLMQLFVVPYASFKQQEIAEIAEGKAKNPRKIPIDDFATFYVTGWPALEKTVAPCDEKLEKLSAAQKKALETERHETWAEILDPKWYPERDRELVGHLIKYVTHIGEGAGTAACVKGSSATCETILTE